jgi:hypothetical protein
MRGSWLLVLALLFFTPAADSGTQPQKGFGFVCARADPRLASEYREALAPLLAKFGGEGVATWGDRAVAVRLSATVSGWLVPISCGATGNCNWAVLAASPARSLGVISGSVIAVRQRDGEWAILETYTGDGPGEGDLTSYEYHNGSYRKITVARLKPAVVDSYQSCIDNESCCPRSAT